MMQLELAGFANITILQKPTLSVWSNKDDKSIYEHRLARVIYAETKGASLPAIESLVVMVRHIGRPISEICVDDEIFESLKPDSICHKDLEVDFNDKKFQLCLRAVRKIEFLPDNIFKAKRFHRSENA